MPEKKPCSECGGTGKKMCVAYWNGRGPDPVGKVLIPCACLACHGGGVVLDPELYGEPPPFTNAIGKIPANESDEEFCKAVEDLS